MRVAKFFKVMFEEPYISQIDKPIYSTTRLFAERNIMELEVLYVNYSVD